MSGLRQGYSKTYRGIFESDEPGSEIASIEIPIIQRDYAQGRADDDTAAIRRDFLDVLIRALTTDESVGLDFVYGEVNQERVLKPLDGQQRLTTLFLLHWYVASRAEALDPNEPWTRLRYATRLSAEYFCRELVTNPWPHREKEPRAWITDQAWYLFPWRTDPTIQSMLVMIGAIHEHLSEGDHDWPRLWERLSSAEAQAISFLFLPIDDMESGDDLYIKMNSRGKPLTEFEIFKARFEKVLHGSGRQSELSEKFDREWSDLLWHYEGGNFLVDEEFMNYLAFVVDVCEWRCGLPAGPNGLLERAQRVFVAHDNAAANLDFLFFSFDTWVSENASADVPAAVFGQLFRTGNADGPGLLLFESQNANLFAACLASYGSTRFSLAETILLYGVLIFRQQCADESQDELERRLRSLRNIAESAPDQVQGPYMADLIESATKLMTEGSLDGLKRFSQAWIDDERRKHALIATHGPDFAASVRGLEDHELLRGRLIGFALEYETLRSRVETFWAVTAGEAMTNLAPALLTKGDFSRSYGPKRQFGVAGQRHGGGSWRDVLTIGSFDGREKFRSALDRLLADVAARDVSASTALEQIVEEWLAEQAATARYHWQYYFVRYPVMLTAPKGIYDGAYSPDTGFGYEIEMMNGADYRSAFKDPYLLAVWSEIGQPERVAKPEFRSWDYTGTEKAMKLIRSGTGIRNLADGFAVLLPEDSAQSAAVQDVLTAFEVGADNVIPVRKTEPGGLDAEDRVQLGVSLTRAILNAEDS